MSLSLASGLRASAWRQSLKALGARVRYPREFVALELHAARVVGMRMDKKGQVMIRHEVVVEAPGPEGPGWQRVVQALASLLEKPDLRNARGEIVVSNHFLRYALVPWRDDIASEDERLALVRHTLARLYGAHMEGWETSISLGRHGAAALAAAMESGLLTALRAVCHAADLVLQSIEPRLVAAFNRACAGLAAPDFWFFSIESGRACLARIQNGEWQSVRCQRIGNDWKAELPVILDRELLLEEVSPALLPVYVHAPAADGQGFIAGQWLAGSLQLTGDSPAQENVQPVARDPAEALS